MTDFAEDQRRLHLLTLKVKIKSLAAEAKIIRMEEFKTHGWKRARLHNHRVVQVRNEARAALLVYGFLRGRSYDDMERVSRQCPDWSRFWKTLRQRRGGVSLQELKQRLAEWMDHADALESWMKVELWSEIGEYPPPVLLKDGTELLIHPRSRQ